MNNNQQNTNIKFDPMTGKPLNIDNNKNDLQIQTQSVDKNNIKFDPMTGKPLNENSDLNDKKENPQVQMQSIPTVDQNNEQFINNIQSTNQEQKEEISSKKNIIFIGILFVVVLIAIFFLFPLLLDYV